ncbi:MAG: enoyl-CoA hydratase-related protein [Actinomycetota bacterium]
MSETLRYETSEGVATITMNRPDKLNAVNAELASALRDRLAEAATSPFVRCVLLTGTGRAFCSGADLSEIPLNPDGFPMDLGTVLRTRYNPIIRSIAGMEKPVVAAVNGVAAGAGCSLALACDFRIAGDSAEFLQAFVRIGLIADAGAHYFLTRLVGAGKAAELLMLGETVGATEAERLGLVTKVVPSARLAEEARAFAERLARGPTRAHGLTKKALHFGSRHGLDATLDFEADLQRAVAHTADSTEGVMAFLQKRAANFEGR